MRKYEKLKVESGITYEASKKKRKKMLLKNIKVRLLREEDQGDRVY